jgi:hypothetical protein
MTVTDVLKRLIRDEGYAGATIALADVIEESANEEDDYQSAEVMRVYAQQLRDVAGE